MKYPVYSVYDSKVNAYDKPFALRSRGEAIRGWADAANDPQTTICKHPEDFSLMELGHFDDTKGTFENHTVPQNLGLASQFKRQPQTDAPLFEQRKEKGIA